MSVLKNKAIQEENKREILNNERDARCLPLALAVIKLFGEMEGHELLTQDKSKTFNAYNGLAQQILALMLERNLPVGEYGYASQLVLKGFDEVNSIVTESLNRHLRTIQDQAFGYQLHELPMQELQSRLVSDTVQSET